MRSTHVSLFTDGRVGIVDCATAHFMFILTDNNHERLPLESEGTSSNHEEHRNDGFRKEIYVTGRGSTVDIYPRDIRPNLCEVLFSQMQESEIMDFVSGCQYSLYYAYSTE